MQCFWWPNAEHVALQTLPDFGPLAQVRPREDAGGAPGIDREYRKFSQSAAHEPEQWNQWLSADEDRSLIQSALMFF